MNSDFQVVRMVDAPGKIALSRSTIYKKIKYDPTFPKQFPLTDSTARGAPVGFLLSELALWVESRIAKREGK
jgi:prophage regulatory protein